MREPVRLRTCAYFGYSEQRTSPHSKRPFFGLVHAVEVGPGFLLKACMGSYDRQECLSYLVMPCSFMKGLIEVITMPSITSIRQARPVLSLAVVSLSV